MTEDANFTVLRRLGGLVKDLFETPLLAFTSASDLKGYAASGRFARRTIKLLSQGLYEWIRETIFNEGNADAYPLQELSRILRNSHYKEWTKLMERKPHSYYAFSGDGTGRVVPITLSSWWKVVVYAAFTRTCVRIINETGEMKYWKKRPGRYCGFISCVVETLKTVETDGAEVVVQGGLLPDLNHFSKIKAHRMLDLEADEFEEWPPLTHSDEFYPVAQENLHHWFQCFVDDEEKALMWTLERKHADSIQQLPEEQPVIEDIPSRTRSAWLLVVLLITSFMQHVQCAGVQPPIIHQANHLRAWLRSTYEMSWDFLLEHLMATIIGIVIMIAVFLVCNWMYKSCRRRCRRERLLTLEEGINRELILMKSEFVPETGHTHYFETADGDTFIFHDVKENLKLHNIVTAGTDMRNESDFGNAVDHLDHANVLYCMRADSPTPLGTAQLTMHGRTMLVQFPKHFLSDGLSEIVPSEYRNGKWTTRTPIYLNKKGLGEGIYRFLASAATLEDVEVSPFEDMAWFELKKNIPGIPILRIRSLYDQVKQREGSIEFKGVIKGQPAIAHGKIVEQEEGDVKPWLLQHTATTYGGSCGGLITMRNYTGVRHFMHVRGPTARAILQGRTNEAIDLGLAYQYRRVIALMDEQLKNESGEDGAYELGGAVHRIRKRIERDELRAQALEDEFERQAQEIEDRMLGVDYNDMAYQIYLVEQAIKEAIDREAEEELTKHDDNEWKLMMTESSAGGDAIAAVTKISCGEVRYAATMETEEISVTIRGANMENWNYVSAENDPALLQMIMESASEINMQNVHIDQEEEIPVTHADIVMRYSATELPPRLNPFFYGEPNKMEKFNFVLNTEENVLKSWAVHSERRKQFKLAMQDNPKQAAQILASVREFFTRITGGVIREEPKLRKVTELEMVNMIVALIPDKSKSVGNPFPQGTKWNHLLKDENTCLLEDFTDLYNRAVEAGAGQAALVYMYIKNEIHKPEKLDEGRYRLICGVSGLDQMMDRLVFYELGRVIEDYMDFTKLHVVKYKGRTFCVRFKFKNKERFENEYREILIKDFENKGYPIIYVGGDDVTIIDGKKGTARDFDFSFNDWLKQDLQKDIENAMFESFYGYMPALVAKRLEVFNHFYVQTPKGTVLEVEGAFETGNLLTYWMNTNQTLFKSLPWLEEIMFQGQPLARATEIAKHQGYKLTKVGQHSLEEGAPFCGFVYRFVPAKGSRKANVHAIPEYLEKHSAKLAYLRSSAADAPARMASYARVYCEDKNLYNRLNKWSKTHLKIDLGNRGDWLKACRKNIRNRSGFPKRIEVGGGNPQNNNNNGKKTSEEGEGRNPERNPERRA